MNAHVDLTCACTYCRSDVDSSRFVSEWIGDKHYKSQTCLTCGRTIHIRVPFESSGHDTWNGKHPFSAKKEDGKVRTLEERIKVVSK